LFIYGFPEILDFVISAASANSSADSPYTSKPYYESEKTFSAAYTHKFSKNLWLSSEIQSGRIEKTAGFIAQKY
jgi:hypothetical protein